MSSGGFFVEAVFFGGRAEGNGAAHGIAQVDLALHHVVPGGRVGILQVGHEHSGAGVQGVDYHLPLHGPGDFHAAVQQVFRQRGHGPVLLANALGFGQEVGQHAGGKLRLPLHAAGQQARGGCGRSGGAARPQRPGPRASGFRRTRVSRHRSLSPARGRDTWGVGQGAGFGEGHSWCESVVRDTCDVAACSDCQTYASEFYLSSEYSLNFKIAD